MPAGPSPGSIRFVQLIAKQWTHDLTNYIMALIPDPENQVYKDGTYIYLYPISTSADRCSLFYAARNFPPV